MTWLVDGRASTCWNAGEAFSDRARLAGRSNSASVGGNKGGDSVWFEVLGGSEERDWNLGLVASAMFARVSILELARW